MPKNTKKAKKDTGSIKDPMKLKELGNKAYAARNYWEALDFYTKALESDSTEPVFYSNRAAVHLALEQWDSCIEDCDCAI